MSSKKKPTFDGLQFLVDHDNSVLVIWYDALSSGTLRLTAEQTVELGRVGKMAGVRRDGRKFLETIGEIKNGLE